LFRFPPKIFFALFAPFTVNYPIPKRAGPDRPLLCELCAFVAKSSSYLRVLRGDLSFLFGCGCAAQVRRGEYSSTLNPEEPEFKAAI
jgi:hypothetical protein